MNLRVNDNVVLTGNVLVKEGLRAGISYDVKLGTKGVVKRIAEEGFLCSVLFDGYDRPLVVTQTILDRV